MARELTYEQRLTLWRAQSVEEIAKIDHDYAERRGEIDRLYSQRRAPLLEEIAEIDALLANKTRSMQTPPPRGVEEAA
jgi:hypothetical protein